MEICTFKVNPFKFVIGHLNTFRVGVCINLCFNFEACPGRGGCNQVDDDFMADQGLPPLIHADVTEHPVFDLIPFAGARWEMANRDAQPGLVGESL